jgi:hypothetical protein
LPNQTVFYLKLQQLQTQQPFSIKEEGNTSLTHHLPKPEARRFLFLFQTPKTIADSLYNKKQPEPPKTQ